MSEMRWNRWPNIVRVPEPLQESFDRACNQFPESVARRGIARLYYGALWQCREVCRAAPNGSLSGVRILDVGSGAGLHALAFAGLGAEVTCIDQLHEYDESNAMGTSDAVERRMKDNGIALVRRDILSEGLGMPDSSFDIITCFEVIEHLAVSPRKLFADIRSALRPGRTMVISTPNHAWVRTRLRLLFGRSAHFDLEAWWEEPYFGHVREYTISELRRMLTWSDFTVTRAVYGNWFHLSSRTGVTAVGETEEWTTRPQLSDPGGWLQAGSLVATTLVPTLRFDMCVTAQKPV